jgi:hypothetical protein
MPRSSKLSLFFRLSRQNLVCTSPDTHTRYMPRPLHSSWFDCPNNICWGIQIINVPWFPQQKIRLAFQKCYFFFSFFKSVLMYVGGCVWTREHFSWNSSGSLEGYRSVAFPRQEWFRERVTRLRHTYIVYLVWWMWVRIKTKAFGGCKEQPEETPNSPSHSRFPNTTVKLPKASTAGVPVGSWRCANFSNSERFCFTSIAKSPSWTP